MFFLVAGQVTILARATGSAAASEAGVESEVMPEDAADMQAMQLNGSATASWWGLAGRDHKSAGGSGHPCTLNAFYYSCDYCWLSCDG